ncbi:hypothetical protein P6166_13140 [Stenotrophomonas sp. HITSZ_GD]|uniref:DUF6116 family protein n=1 Tax=Stenotrophomonas sp. HITSZ_GD TaxID=3037248 RepID=UPI00240E0C66|nr:DUF6116 family protein [Stenotrophomonas sp. HITSZ_GD]MDG2526300.1 hypothetical protein [Stenotrophomonas sp. HITSZ_GD]
MPNPFAIPLLNWAGRLRYPTLAKFVAALFVIDLLLPDPVPFVDEIVLGMATLLLTNWKYRKGTPPPLPGN